MTKLWFFISLIGFSTIVLSEDSYSGLEQADILRTSDPKKSQLLLDKVDEKRLNSHDKDLFLYLTGLYHLVNGEPHQAISNFQMLTTA
jgi:hypothetical protein